MTSVRRLNVRTPWASLTLVLLDDRGIEPVQRACFGSAEPTDVISFAYPPLPGESGWHGEVLVNVERAAREGARRVSVCDELALYVAHGCDHLAGADDDTPARRRAMRDRERRWLRAAGRDGLLEGLVAGDDEQR